MIKMHLRQRLAYSTYFIFLVCFDVHALPTFPYEAPVDGGLGALLIAGGALGYKAYKERKTNSIERD